MQFRILLSLFFFFFFLLIANVSKFTRIRLLDREKILRFHVLTAVKYFVDDMEIFTSFLN